MIVFMFHETENTAMAVPNAVSFHSQFWRGWC